MDPVSTREQADAPLAALDPGGPSAGFFALPPLGRLVELTRQPSTAPATAAT